ncbi:MAG: hypothetical protein IT289_08750 [Oligoflexia bacterium]|nr:hypothetical protein [Oligoflexia bacterium]
MIQALLLVIPILISTPSLGAQTTPWSELSQVAIICNQNDKTAFAFSTELRRAWLIFSERDTEGFEIEVSQWDQGTCINCFHLSGTLIFLGRSTKISIEMEHFPQASVRFENSSDELVLSCKYVN